MQIQPSSSGASPFSLGETLPSGVELIVIDESVDEPLELISTISGNRERVQFEVVTIASKIDGLDQITAILASRRNLAAIHLVGCDLPRGIQLGCSTWTTDMLEIYASDVVGWQDAMVSDAEIFVYGSSPVIAAAGTTLLTDSLSALTGANVSAFPLDGHRGEFREGGKSDDTQPRNRYDP